MLLVAKPDMPDPRFRETVVLATQAPDGHTVGVILNRPTGRKLSEFLPEGEAQPVSYGGPVMEQAVVALFRSTEPPAAPAFRVLRNLYISMHPRAIEPYLRAPRAQARFFVGFSGWAPGQLKAELDAGGWYILPATETLAFRTETARMWMELVEKARGFRTRAAPDRRAILNPP